MKRLSMFVSLFTMLLLMGVAIASASPPDNFCDRKPDHPNCPTTTTTPPEPPITQPCPTGPIALSGIGQQGFECDWTPAVSSDETGTVTVETVSGEVTRLVIIVRDSSPGDICVLDQDTLGPLVEATFDLVKDGESYWDNPIHWCDRFDTVDGQREDLNGEPLHLRVNFRGKRGTEVLISLSPGQVDSG